MTYRLQAAVVCLLSALTTCEASEAAWYELPRSQAEAAGRLAALRGRIEQAPRDAALRFEAAKLLHFFDNDQKGAIEHLKVATQVDPRQPAAWHLRALVESVGLDFRSSLLSSLKACQADPNHPSAESAARRIADQFWRVQDYSQAVKPTFESLYASPQLRNPGMRDLLRQVLLRIYEDAGDPKGRDRLLADAGYVHDWLVVGPFGKSVASAMASEFAPETEDQPGDEYLRHPAMAGTGRERVVPRVLTFHQGWVRPRMATPDGVIYFVAYARADEQARVHLVVDSGYSHKVFVDRTPVVDNQRLLRWLPMRRHVGLDLARGWHKIVVKLLSMDRTSPSFSLRLTRPDGGRAGLKVQAKFDTYPALGDAAGAKTHPPWLGAMTDLHRLCAKDPVPAWPALILSGLESDRANTQVAKELLLKAREGLPSYSLACHALGDLFQTDPSLHPGVARSRSREWYRKALDLWPQGVAPWLQLALLDVRDKLPLEALKKIDKCQQAHPGRPEWDEARFAIFRGKGWQKEADAACDVVMQRLPDTPTGAKLGIGYWAARGAFDLHARAARTIAQHDRDSSSLALFYESTRELERAEQEYRRLIEWEPDAYRHWAGLARVQQGLGQPAAVAASIERQMELQGSTRQAYQGLAQVRFAQGDRKGAVECLHQALREDPSSSRIQRSLYFLGEPDPTERFAISYEETMADKVNHDRPHRGAEAAFLLDQAVAVVNPDGSSCERVHCIIKVYNKKGVERWGEVNLPRAAEVLRLRTIKPDGAVVEPEMIPYKSAYSMSGLSPGDVVDYEYLEFSDCEGFPGAYRGPVFSFKDEHAQMETSQYIIVTPRDWELDVDGWNSPPKTARSLLRGRRVYKWEATAVKESGTEENSVPREEILPSIRVTRGLAWQDVRDRLVSEIAGQFRPSYELEQVTRDLAAKHQTGPDRLKAAYDYVNTHIIGNVSSAYFGQSASMILSLGKGNRLVLLKALLDGLGVESHVVRVAPRIDARVSVKCPDPYARAFGSAVLRVRLKGQPDLWVDTLFRHLPLGYLLPAHRESAAIVLDPAADEPLISTPPQLAQKDLAVTEADFELDVTGGVKARVREVHHGLFAVALRLRFQRAKPAQRRHAYERRLAQRFRRATLTSFQIHELEDSPKPLVFEYAFQAEGFMKIGGPHGILRIGFQPQWTGRTYAARRSRRSGTLITAPTAVRSRIRIKLPPGVHAELPSDVKEKTRFGEISYTYRMDGRTLVGEREVRLPIQRIGSKSYRKFAPFARKIDEEDVREIKLRVDPGAVPKKAGLDRPGAGGTG